MKRPQAVVFATILISISPATITYTVICGQLDVGGYTFKQVVAHYVLK